LLESHDTYIVYIFSSIVTFAVIRQYTNAKALRIEASNRVAMAKMFDRVKNENNEYSITMTRIITELLPQGNLDSSRGDSQGSHKTAMPLFLLH
jgi:hypothetical protein